tara:strand:- start:23 stop:169 length:147 start_codon:yes stop_codon:yes gene_type:complete
MEKSQKWGSPLLPMNTTSPTGHVMLTELTKEGKGQIKNTEEALFFSAS